MTEWVTYGSVGGAVGQPPPLPGNGPLTSGHNLATPERAHLSKAPELKLLGTHSNPLCFG